MVSHIFLIVVYTYSDKWLQVSSGEVLGEYSSYKETMALPGPILSQGDLASPELVSFVCDHRLKSGNRVRDTTFSLQCVKASSFLNPWPQRIWNKRKSWISHLLNQGMASFVKHCLQTMILCRILRSIEFRNQLTFHQGNIQGVVIFQSRKHSSWNSLCWLSGFKNCRLLQIDWIQRHKYWGKAVTYPLDGF